MNAAQPDGGDRGVEGDELERLPQALEDERQLRLRADLGVNFAGAAIIVDLVARLQWMDDMLARLRGVTTPIPTDKAPS